MKYTLRKIEDNDIKELAIIMKQAFSCEPWHENWNEKSCYDRLMLFNHISSSINCALIDENNSLLGAAIGYVVPFLNEKEYAFQEFFIAPEFKNNHLGTFFMNELLSSLKENGVTKIKFYTSGSLDKFYSKFGFQKVNNEYLMDLKIQ